MKIISSQQSLVISGGYVAPVVAGAVVLAVMPFISPAKNYSYTNTGAFVGIMLADHFVNGDDKSLSNFGMKVAVVGVGYAVGAVQEYFANSYFTSTSANNQTVV